NIKVSRRHGGGAAPPHQAERSQRVRAAMTTHLEESLERDIERIRTNVREMAGLAERALKDGVKALVEKDRQLAYAVILRDSYVDEKEKEIDRLCLEFLIRQTPVAG